MASVIKAHHVLMGFYYQLFGVYRGHGGYIIRRKTIPGQYKRVHDRVRVGCWSAGNEIAIGSIGVCETYRMSKFMGKRKNFI